MGALARGGICRLLKMQKPDSLQLQHYDLHEKDQNRCQLTRFMGSKYTQMRLRPWQCQDPTPPDPRGGFKGLLGGGDWTAGERGRYGKRKEGKGSGMEEMGDGRVGLCPLAKITAGSHAGKVCC